MNIQAELQAAFSLPDDAFYTQGVSLLMLDSRPVREWLTEHGVRFHPVAGLIASPWPGRDCLNLPWVLLPEAEYRRRTL